MERLSTDIKDTSMQPTRALAIHQREYQARRAALSQAIPSNTVAIIPSAEEVARNGDAHYRFRQSSDFYYLTGFNEPDAVLVIYGQSDETLLFNRLRDPLLEQWNGRRLGQEGAAEALGVSNAYPIDEFGRRVLEVVADRTAVYIPFGKDIGFERKIMDALQSVKAQVRRGVNAPVHVSDISPILSEMRLFKSPSEIAIMQKAADISVRAHIRAMQHCKHLSYEYELEAELLYEFTRQGCRAPAYDPIVGSGANACILHYTENEAPFAKNGLVLVDAGGEFLGYASDITRTFPVNGRFSPEQRAVYDIVLDAQQAGIAEVKPGVAWHRIQQVMVEMITKGLSHLGFIKGHLTDLIATEAYKPFYMHSSGHWLGLDVHDCGQYKINGQWRPLEAGMVLTVEPGIYIREGMENVPPEFYNIGVRIEDDILVTKAGHVNLTEQLPVAVNEIEALMRG